VPTSESGLSRVFSKRAPEITRSGRAEQAAICVTEACRNLLKHANL
jgi:hypothetical protein